MLALKLNKKRMAALLVAVALLVPMWPAARAETTIDPPAQGEPGVPSTPEDPSVPATPEGGDELENTTPDNEVTTTPDTPETPPLAVPLDSRVDTPNDTLLVTQATPDQAPNIHLESNLVLDALGNPNGFVELAVKVTTSPGETMRSLSLSVQYSDLLTPVDWTTGGDVTLGLGNFSTHIPAKHSDRVTGAAAYGGGTDRYLYIEAESIEPAALTNGIVAVVRFRYDVSTTPLLYQGNEIVKVTNVGSGYNPDDPTTATTASVGDLFPLVPDAVAATEPRAMQAVWYESADNSFYYVNGYDGTAANEDTVTIPVNGVDTSFQKPKTAGNSVLAVRADKDPTTGTPADYYSYLSNLIPSGNITTTQVSQPSYDQSGGGITLDDVATVVFFDWDDTFLGATAVARGIDNRQTINDFVKNLMIHPDLKSNTNYSSLDRKDTYRGEYPCENPTTGVKFPDDHATQPGKNYPLTNKLDYAFYKKVVEVKNGVPTVTAASDATYPYIHGWQPVTPQNLSDTWTALESNQAVASVDFKKITEDVVYVKALYEPGTTLNYGTTISGAFLSYYSISGLQFGRIGAASTVAGDYTSTFSVRRMNQDGYGTTRRKEVIIRQELTLGGSRVFLKNSTDNGEYISVTTVLPRTAESFSIVVVDEKESSLSYTIKNNYSTLYTFYPLKAGTHPESGSGFITEGTLGFILEAALGQGEAVKVGETYGDWENNVSSSPELTVDLPFTDEIADIRNQTSASTAARRTNVAKNRILLYIAGRGISKLSVDDVRNAITMNTGSGLTYTTTAAYLGFRVDTVQRAFAINNFVPLTSQEIIALCNELTAANRALSEAEIRVVLGL